MRGLLLDHCSEEGAELEGHSPDLPSIPYPTITYGHELYIVTERMKSQIQMADMSLLLRLGVLSISDRLRGLDIRREFGADPLFLHIKRS